MLYASEFLWVLNTLDYSSSIFDMAEIVFYSRVEDIREAVFPHKDVGKYSNAF